MEAIKLAGLEPKAFMGYFEAICGIPHGSGNTKAISDYLVAFAKEQGISYIQDSLNNVIMFQEGTAGYEDHPPVVIQGHMDMVCQKDADCPIDMEKEGLDVTHDGEWIFAKGTTLGADDGVAVAYAMALLADKTIAHPPLEVIITVDEETGMFGAADIDLSQVRGRTLINLDSDDEGIFTVSCAGGARAHMALPVERRAIYGPCVRLVVEGLRGGHSGAEIDKNRANANKVMGLLLERVQKIMPISLTQLSGGDKDNVIPYFCQCTLVTLGMNPERINEIARDLEEEIRREYDEPNVSIHGDNVDALGGNGLSTEDTARVIALLNSVPNGIQAWSQDIQGLPQTSLNLGVLMLEDNLELEFAVRSSVNQEKRELLDRLIEVAKFHGAQYTESGDYPAWEYKKDSRLLDVMVKSYRQLFGKEPKVQAIHAGLECGLLSEKLPGLDCVSIAPDMRDIHTSRERLNIASTERTWKLLVEVLKNL